MADEYKTCPECQSSVGDWRSRCECGHVFFVEKTLRVAVRDEPGELADLIDDLERKRAGKRPKKRKPKTRETRSVVVRERPGLATYADRPRGTPSDQSPGLGKVGCGLLAAGAIAVLAIMAIVQAPLQVIAAMLVILVLGGGIVVIRQR